MGILSTLLSPLSGITGGTANTVGEQVLGVGDLDLSSTAPITLYTQPDNSNAYILFNYTAILFPTGEAPNDPSGFPLYVSVFLNGVQVASLPGNEQNYAPGAPRYVSIPVGQFCPMPSKAVITAKTQIPSPVSKVAKIVVMGIAVPIS